MSNIEPEKIVAWTVGPYLVIHTLFLSGLAIFTWLAPADFDSVKNNIPFISFAELSNDKFVLFKKAIIAACCAGLGGGVFMIKNLFIQYAEGVEYTTGKRESLRAREIPRFILLPISSVIIGPISLCLLKAGGVIAFGGFSGIGPIPMVTVIAVSFIMGLTYNDTLHAFCELSKRLFGRTQTTKL